MRNIELKIYMCIYIQNKQFKPTTLTLKALHSGYSRYLTSLLKHHQPWNLSAHPLLISYLFRNISCHLDLVLSTSAPLTACLHSWISLTSCS